MNDEAVYRTALATQGLLKIAERFVKKMAFQKMHFLLYIHRSVSYYCVPLIIMFYIFVLKPKPILCMQQQCTLSISGRYIWFNQLSSAGLLD